MFKSRIKLSISLLLSVLMLGLLSVSEPIVINADDSRTANTEASINFLPNTDKTDPVDPDNPYKPVKPEKPDGKDPEKGTDGPLSIDYISDFDFGNQKISNSDQTYYAKAQSYKGDKQDTALYAQVTDNRGTLEGWQLGVRQPHQLTTEINRYGRTETHELKGAQISINDINTRSNAEDELGREVLINAPFGEAINLTPGEDSTSLIMTNTGGYGGTAVALMGSTSDLSTDQNGKDGSKRNIDKSVSLYVPGKSSQFANHTYTTDLVWELQDVPIAS